MQGFRGEKRQGSFPAHSSTLKGICSNLGFDELYKASYDLTEDLRDGELSGYEQDYEKVLKNIR